MSNQKLFNTRSCSIGLLVLGLIGIPVLLAGGYYLTGYITTRRVESNFADYNCTYVLEKSPTLKKYYPERIAPFVKPVPDLEAECRVYTDAADLQAEGLWEAAYESYLAYLDTYPDGKFSRHVQDALGETLFSWALEDETSLAFEEAEERLFFLMEAYPKTAAAQEGTAYLPELTLHWAQYIDSQKDFKGAEKKLAYLADEYPESEAASAGKAYLAVVYLHWAQDLHDKRTFQSAEAIYKKAKAADPDPEAEASPTVQVEESLTRLYREWANHLLGTEEFDAAIAKLLTLQQRLPAEQRGEIKSQMGDAYLQWAEALQKEGNFTEALTKTRSAQAYAADADQEAAVEAMNAKVLDRYAHSDGEQAEELMDTTTASICKNGLPAASTLIGLDDQDVRIYFRVSYVIGSLYSITNTLKATTPANMHYVACVERKKTLIQTCPYRTSSGTITIRYVQRYRVSWDVTLRDAKTGKTLGQQLFNGSPPKACGFTESFMTSEKAKSFTGDNPVAAVEAWIKGLLP